MVAPDKIYLAFDGEFVAQSMLTNIQRKGFGMLRKYAIYLETKWILIGFMKRLKEAIMILLSKICANQWGVKM